MVKIEKLVQSAISDKVFSAIAIEVKQRRNTVFSLYRGRIFFQNDKDDNQKPPHITPHHLFDLSSLTKPLCTALLCSILLDKKIIELNTKISEILDKYAISFNKELKDITIGQLMNHSSGLDSWYQIYKVVKSRSDAYMFVRSRSLSYMPETKHLYSDLGYILLGEIIEVLLDKKLDQLFDSYIASPLGLKNIFYCPIDVSDRKDDVNFVSTGFSEVRDKILIGEVNDENSYILGGVSGHAGLFSTALDVSTLGQYVLDVFRGRIENPIFSSKTIQRIFKRSSDSSDWAYGWHYPSKNNSSVGMTGFTGTSLWIDIDNNIVITMLSNRTISPNSAKFGGKVDKFTKLRSTMHDTIMGELI